MRQAVRVGAALAVLVLATGCGGGSRKIVPVSGVVTVDGRPAEGVIVTFQPLAAKDEGDPGRGSSAITGPDGRYVLVYDGEKEGALTGKHRVKISPQFVGGKANPDETEGEGNTGLRLNYKIPPSWSDESKVEFEVPPGGTDKADFNIETAAPPKRRK